MKVQSDPDSPFEVSVATDLALDSVATAQLGALGEAAPASDTAASGLNGRLQRVAQRLTSLIGNFIAGGTTADSPGLPAMGRYRATPPTLVDGEYRAVLLDSRNNLRVALVAPDNTASPVTTTSPSDAVVNSSGPFLKTTAFLMGYNASSWDRVRADANGLVVQADALASARWSYAAAASGIANTTTAVTFIGAAGAGVRNYVKSIDVVAEALTNATELVIRDGAGGTVLWRVKIGTAGWPSGRDISFDPPLRGSANTLMEVATLTASGTGAVYFNARGFQGT